MTDGSPYQPPAAPLETQPEKEKRGSEARNPGRGLLLLVAVLLAVRLGNQWRQDYLAVEAAAREEGQTREEFLQANPDALEWQVTGRKWLGAGAMFCAAYVACGLLTARYPVGTRAAGILLLGAEAFCAQYLQAPYLTRAWWLQFLFAAMLFGGLLAERNRRSVARIRKRLGYDAGDG